MWLEGRRSGNNWHNWTHGQFHRVAPYLLPASEQEIVEAVRAHPRLRVVGAGHSFNAGATNEATLSLDAYTGIVEVDRAGKRVRVRAGTRVRGISRILLEEEKTRHRRAAFTRCAEYRRNSLHRRPWDRGGRSGS